jgi:hypothetical protein
MHQHFNVRAGRLTKALFLILSALVLINVLISLQFLHGTGEIRGWARIFSLDGERNLPTAFNVFLLLANASLLLLITACVAQKKLMQAAPWLILALGFLFMSMDEAWTIHEDLIGPVRQQLGGKHMGLLYNAWIIPGIAIVALLGLSYIRFLVSLPRATRIGFIISAFVYLSGALGMEALDGDYFEAHGNDFIYKMYTIVEEGLEMAGMILFSKYLLHYIRLQFGTISMKVASQASTERQPAKATPDSKPVETSLSLLPPLLPVSGQRKSDQQRS